MLFTGHCYKGKVPVCAQVMNFLESSQQSMRQEQGTVAQVRRCAVPQSQCMWCIACLQARTLANTPWHKTSCVDHRQMGSVRIASSAPRTEAPRIVAQAKSAELMHKQRMDELQVRILS